MEWEGEYAHFRKYYADAFELAKQGYSILWVADLPKVGLIGQLFVQLSSGRKELADGFGRAYIYGFRIRSEFRGNGLGKRMMAIIESDLHQRGFKWVTLNVSRDNTGALRLYEKIGYHVVAPEAGRWSFVDQFGRRQEVNEPAWRMEKYVGNQR